MAGCQLATHGIPALPGPAAALRRELCRRGMMTCRDLLHLRGGRRVVVPGIMLVRQQPGSAKETMFITI